MKQHPRRSMPGGVGLASALILIGALAGASPARAVDVSVSFVTDRDGRSVPLQELQSLWKSPFGGWVTVTWAFGLRVDDTAIMEYKSAFDKLLDESESGLKRGGPADSRLSDMVGDLLGEKKVEAADLLTFKFDRPSTAQVELPPGEHTISPGNLRFTVKPDGSLETANKRLRVARDGNGIEVICHPVTIRALSDKRSVPFPIRLTCGSHNLLGGLTGPIEEFESKAKAGTASSESQGFRRVTLYVPASHTGNPYGVSGATFEVDPSGQVKSSDEKKLRMAGSRELHLLLPPSTPSNLRIVGVCWAGANSGIQVSAAGNSASSMDAAGSMFVRVPAAGRPVVSLGTASGQPAVNVTLPATFDAWPFKTILFDASEPSCRLFETARFAARPGGDYTCRISALTAKTAALNGDLVLQLQPVGEEGKGTDFKPAPRDDSTFSASLPSSVGPGLWCVAAGPGSPAAGQPLGLVFVSASVPTASLSLYTYKNRGVFRQGDEIALFWTLKGKPGAAEMAILLKGQTLEREIARIKAAPGGTTESGRLRLDTAALAPGSYEVAARADGLACYAARFRICRRDPPSDFEIYSYVFGTVKPSGGLPLTAYYDCRLAAEPGLQPLMREARGGLDPVFAVYASAPEGPAIELCEPPSDEEAGMMALAGIGAVAVPAMPRMIHHEEWNPKHSLPEELTQMRRRLALFTQQYADVPGFGGVALNWYATLNGYWEESKPLDGRQAARNAAAARWIADMTAARVEEEKKKDADPKHLDAVKRQTQFEYTSRVLPAAYGEYLADARVIRPDLTSHSGIPSFWLGGGSSYSPVAFSTLSHRDSVDYTDCGISPWGNFRAPAFLDMGNPGRQKTYCCYMTYGRHSRVLTAFGAAGRGLDGLSLSPEDPYSRGEDEALLRIFQRFGSYFTALDPLPDVAVYFSPLHPWSQQKSVALHDLARLRRPGMLLSQDDVLRGGLKDYHVLFLAGLGDGEPKEALDAFKTFERNGGVILKDRTCAAGIPGRDIGFAYDKEQVHNGWGLAYPDGEWEFAHLWTNFLEHREKPLLAAFAGAPQIPVGTADHEALISPLAGKESLCCFVMNAVYVPMSVEGKWRQHAVLPRQADLLVREGWHTRDLLRGKPCELKRGADCARVTMDFSRVEGGIYLLTKRAPKAMAMRTERRGAAALRLAAWLADENEQPIGDPMPFEVTLEGPGSATLFHKYAALSPDLTVDVPVPALPAGAALDLRVRDLVIGCSAAQKIEPAPPDIVAAENIPDVIGGDHARDFFGKRKGRVVVLLDERQAAYRAAAEQVAALLGRHGREARIVTYDPAEVRLLPLRWKWIEEDLKILESVRKGDGIAWRVNLTPWSDEKNPFEDPAHGYSEYGPRTWLESDVILFGLPSDSLALADLQPYLRRCPSDSYPSEGRYFIHYLWDPFFGGYDGIYLGCRDAAGAEAAVAYLAESPPPAAKDTGVPPAAAAPVVTRGAGQGPIEDMVTGRFGAAILDAAYTPSGNRIFVTADSYGDSLFVLSPTGEIVGRRPIHNRCGNSLWWRAGGTLSPVNDTQLRIRVGADDYLLDLDRGFQTRSVNPPHGFAGRFQVKIGGPTILRDAPRGRAYLGGARRLRALDKEGRLLWSYDDMIERTSTDDMLYPRSIFVRALSPDGRHLLAAAFGIEQDCYGIGTIRNPSVFCVDASSGRLAWERDGLVLNEGKVVSLDTEFLVVDDGGRLHLLAADSGQEQGNLRPVGGTDWILPVPNAEALLIVENNHFDRNGPTAHAYLRPLGDKPDITLATAGRVTDAVAAPDGRTVFLASERGRTACFSTAGDALWEAETPAGGIVRLAPDGKTVLVGTREGRVHFLNRQDGRLARAVDLNPFNVFVNQMKAIGDVPPEKTATLPPDSPSPSYLKSLNPEAVTFGPNLAPSDPILLASNKGAEFNFKVEAGGTYLVELLAAAADPAKLTAQTRIEIAVTGGRKTANLPYVARMPLTQLTARRRAAFRADESGEVTLSLRVVRPRLEGDGQQAKAAYTEAEAGDTGANVGELVVAKMSFAGSNLLLDKGPAAGSAPKGSIECKVTPWTGGNSTIRWRPYPAHQAALRLVDGIVANQETAWTTEATGSQVAYADGIIRFVKPQTVSAAAVFEDNSGPVPADREAKEKVSMRFGLYAHEARSGKWVRVGYAADNTDLVNVFTFPPIEADQMRYFWAGRDHAGATDGIVRTAELEVYSSEDAALLLDAPAGGKEGGLKLDL